MIFPASRRRAATALGAALTITALTGTYSGIAPAWAINGIDVADHQHPGGAAIDWNAVAASGQRFVFVKATEGTHYVNAYFSSDSVKAQEAGLYPGSYHYARPGINDPRAEARFYAATLSTGAQPSLPPVLDIEEDGGLSPAALQKWVRGFVTELKKLTGRQPIIYTYYTFWKQNMANTTEFAEYPLWLAYYDNKMPDDIPGGWSEITFWQHSGSGSVDGVITKVDLNKYHGNDATLQALVADLRNGTPAGDISHFLDPFKHRAGFEAGIANRIEQATGVDVPLPADFLMTLLGVAGGRLPVDALLPNGAKQKETAPGTKDARKRSANQAVPGVDAESIADGAAKVAANATAAVNNAIADANARQAQDSTRAGAAANTQPKPLVTPEAAAATAKEAVKLGDAVVRAIPKPEASAAAGQNAQGAQGTQAELPQRAQTRAARETKTGAQTAAKQSQQPSKELTHTSAQKPAKTNAAAAAAAGGAGAVAAAAAKPGANPLAPLGELTPEKMLGLTALAGALEEFQATGQKLPVELLGRLMASRAASTAPAAGAAGAAAPGNGAVTIGQLLGLLHQFGQTSDWNAKLKQGSVKADPQVLTRLLAVGQKVV